MKEWIFTTDHKRIGIMYLVGSMAAFVVAGIMALLIRTELAAVGPTLTENAGNYNVWLYFHGAAMILAFLIPALTGFFANYLIPLMIGAHDVAFPRINAFSIWLFYVAIVLALSAFMVPDPPDVMWTGYPPYSVQTTGNTSMYVFTVHLLGFSSILGAVNFLCTVIYMRAPGMGWNQLNFFVWCTLAAFVIQLIFIPVLATAVTLLLFDKYFGTAYFAPDAGGDVLLYQNLFWFYSHPAVYVILIPAVGIVAEVIAAMARNPIFNYKVAVYGGAWAIVVLGSDVWVHHLYTSGMVDWLRIGMMVTTLIISVPVGLLMISLVGTLYRGSIQYNTAMLYAISVLFLFLIGGLTGIPLAMTSITLHLAETYFVMAHFHYVMAVSATFAVFAGVYFWFPKFSGRMYNETIGKIGFALNFIGINLTFWPLFQIGVDGMPRRYFDYAMFPEFEPTQLMATYGAYCIALSMVVVIFNWVYSAIAGPKAPLNPWGSKSLEWTHTQSPPGPGNFPTPPTVSADWSPYNYGKHTAQTI